MCDSVRDAAAEKLAPVTEAALCALNATPDTAVAAARTSETVVIVAVAVILGKMPGGGVSSRIHEMRACREAVGSSVALAVSCALAVPVIVKV